VIERLDAPEGAQGFRVFGEVTKRDYDEVLIPLIRDAIEAGEELRFLCQVGPDFEGYEAGAVWDDIKTGLKYGVGDHSSWKRIALVTDIDWVRSLAGLFGWMTPGELKLFSLDEIDRAKAWVVA